MKPKVSKVVRVQNIQSTINVSDVARSAVKFLFLYLWSYTNSIVLGFF